jgi:CheY-like chemotaxis protein/HPt (histidine-containing phosphotransfer) domain-containing protein
VAGSGREALAALDEERFDLMFADVQMPDMDGYELTAAVREWESSRDRRLPVIAMTAHAMKGVRERCLAAGMDDYVSKPIRDEELLAAIKRTCPARIESADDTFGHRLQDTGELYAHNPVPPPAAIDEDELLTRVGGNQEVLSGLINVFYKDCNGLMSDLRAAIRDGDAQGVRAAAHTIKGMVAFFEAQELVEVADRLERVGVRGDLSDANQLCGLLSQGLSRIEPALTVYAPSPPAGWHLGRAEEVDAENFNFYGV